MTMMLSTALLSASRNRGLRRLVVAAPVTRRVVERFVAGEDLTAALAAVRKLLNGGLFVTLDHLGEDISSVADTHATRDAYLNAVEALAAGNLAEGVELSIKLSAFGLGLPGGHDLAVANAEAVAAAAADAGTTVTLDMEDSGTVDATLAVLTELRDRFPGTGAVLQAYLLRTPDDAARLAYPGSRVRLVKGAYREPPSVAHQDRAAVDHGYEQCLELLMAGGGYPMIGSHDPRMIATARRLAEKYGRDRDSYEFQMLYGVRPEEQQRLADAGHRMRTYVPYGTDWYGYFMRRLAERPANLRFFLRSLTSRS